MNKEFRNIHFIGIAGAGMMPLAIHAKALGYEVTGSDLNDQLFEELQKEEIYPVKGHHQLPAKTDLVVYSSAVRNDNLEYQQALERKIPLMKRADFLGYLTKDSHSYLVSGSHGKSTTSVMLADILNNYPKINSSAIIGAKAVSVSSNYYRGSKESFVIEADEYDRSFLKMYPNDLIILNIDSDHLDIYGNIDNLIATFELLIKKLSKESVLVINGEDQNCQKIIKKLARPYLSFGLGDQNNFYPKNIAMKKSTIEFDLYHDQEFVDSFKFRAIGNYNLLNMVSVLALLISKGLDPKILKELLLKYQGLSRRMEIIYNDNDYLLIDDYAHHSTEIENVLRAVKENFKRRIVALFQPHLFSRTKYQYSFFAKSLGIADQIYISQIYPAREKNDGSVTSKIIKEAMTAEIKNKTSVFDNFEDLYQELKKNLKAGDLIISLGAGEINKVLYKLRDHLKGGSNGKS